MLLPFLPCQYWHVGISTHYCLVLQVVSQHLGILSKPLEFYFDIEGYTFGFWCPSFSRGGSKVSIEFISFLWRFLKGGWCLFFLSSQPFPIGIFTWVLCSWGYFLGWLSIIRSAKVVGKSSSRSRASWLVWSTNYVEYLRYFNPLLFWWSIVQGGLQHFWKISFVLLTSIPGSIFSDFCYPLPFTKKVLTGRFPSLWRSFVCSHLLLFIWVGEDKNRGNNIIG